MMITIFTPSYNRAYILPNLYQSLLKQIDMDFEWVVVDDGSTDDTEELVKGWQKENKIIIQYYRQPNQGKHIAINTGVGLAKGELFFIVDSDDDLTVDAVVTVNKFWKESNHGNSISGILSYRQFRDGRLVGNRLPSAVRQCKLRDTGRLYGSQGDKVVIYRTSVMKRYPFPKFGEERFLGESYVYNQIDDEYDMLVMDAQIYNFDYQDDGLSQNFRKLYRNNPLGFIASYEQGLKYCRTFKERLKTCAHLDCLSFKTGSFWRSLGRDEFTMRILAIPIGILLYLKIFVIKSNDVKPFIESEGK